jgi:hypothetical protein
MVIKSFTPCSDWFFVFRDPQDKLINYRLAGWAVTEDPNGNGDIVVGMVPVSGGGSDKIMPELCRLVVVPPVAGTYQHDSGIRR